MTSQPLRDRLHRDIDALPVSILVEVADFTAYLMAKREAAAEVGDWTEDAWHTFAIEQFFRDGS